MDKMIISTNYQIDKERTLNFICYINKMFKINLPQILIKMAENKKSDNEIYNFIKSKLSIYDHDKNYIENLKRKAESIFKLTYQYLPKGNILDIGTEDIEFLKMLENKFGCDAYGINIADCIGYNNSSKNYDKFSIYDKIIPHPNKNFVLVTILSVIHHIRDEDLQNFISEACRVCSHYIYVKDVNLICQSAIDFFTAQHDIFEGGIVGSKPYYRNNNITAERIIAEFKKNNFKLHSIIYQQNFNNTIIAIFMRI